MPEQKKNYCNLTTQQNILIAQAKQIKELLGMDTKYAEICKDRLISKSTGSYISSEDLLKGELFYNNEFLLLFYQNDTKLTSLVKGIDIYMYLMMKNFFHSPPKTALATEDLPDKAKKSNFTLYMGSFYKILFSIMPLLLSITSSLIPLYCTMPISVLTGATAVTRLNWSLFIFGTTKMLQFLGNTMYKHQMENNINNQIYTLNQYIENIYYSEQTKLFLLMQEYYPDHKKIEQISSDIGHMVKGYYMIQRTVVQISVFISNISMLFYTTSGIQSPYLSFLPLSNPLACIILLNTTASIYITQKLSSKIVLIKNEQMQLKREGQRIRNSANHYHLNNYLQEFNKSQNDVQNSIILLEKKIAFYNMLQTTISAGFSTCNVVFLLWAISPLIIAGTFTYTAIVPAALSVVMNLHWNKDLLVSGIKELLNCSSYGKEVRKFVEEIDICRYSAALSMMINIPKPNVEDCLLYLEIQQLKIIRRGLLIDQVTASNENTIHIQKGDLIAIHGNNGIGKTTLTKLISGIYPEASGKIYRTDSIWLAAKEMSFKSPPSTLKYFFATHGIKINGSNKEYINDLIAIFQLQDLISDIEETEIYPRNFSDDQRQMIQIIMALTSGKELIIFDEITCHLSNDNKAKVKQQLKKAVENKDIAILHVTHDPGFDRETYNGSITIEEQELQLTGVLNDRARAEKIKLCTETQEKSRKMLVHVRALISTYH